MLILAATLSVVMGLVLGLLGGGGSILTIPILVYAIGLGPKEAIATSLLVVGTTSLVGALRYARKGLVQWRTGLIFASVAMVGAYFGGRFAEHLPGSALLMMFVGLMLVTGLAMLRPRKAAAAPAKPTRRSFPMVAVQGLGVGAVTGLVGAGGGFLVVPALVLLSGMSIRAAVGTSLLVIALNSAAGLAGHLAHATVDPILALVVTVAAVAGTLVGTSVSSRVPAASLRRTFAVFVLAMGTFMGFKEAPAGVLDAVFVARWPFGVGGAAVAAVVLGFLLVGRRTLGVSAGFVDVCAVPTDAAARRSWRLPFMGGIVLGGLLAAMLSGGLSPTLSMGMFDTLWSASLLTRAVVFIAGGVLVGFGARLAGGCTSGHGIVGMAQLAPSSLMATGAFMVAGFATTQLLFNV